MVLVDHWLSAIVYGRAVATVAELAYAAQLARYFQHAWIVPLLVVAELLSWFAIATVEQHFARNWSAWTSLSCRRTVRC